ncbi:MAG: hypothetical protein EA350_05770 [Gemmatimonadales bacterium]|nr:MAG: hypothetical protein EA350_05770 [Gemmatimonadales bacterium]
MPGVEGGVVHAAPVGDTRRAWHPRNGSGQRHRSSHHRASGGILRGPFQPDPPRRNCRAVPFSPTPAPPGLSAHEPMETTRARETRPPARQARQDEGGDRPGSAPRSTPLSDRQLHIDTPEQVPVGYALAGPGSRFAAFLIDALLLTLSLVAVGTSALLTLVAMVGWAGIGRPANWIIAAAMIGLFVVVWGYFILFEGLRGGQTPGKRWMGLRVIHASGFPLTLPGAVIRNLVRILDLQPFPTGLVGGSFILFHPRAQRPGDLAAGTVVIRERPAGALPEEREADGAAPVLDEPAYQVLRSWALQHKALERKARIRIMRRLHAEFRQRLPGILGDDASEGALLELYASESGRRAATGIDTGSGTPAAASLLRRQRPRWERWRALLDRAGRGGLPGLPEPEVSEFASLYREVTADLARARTYRASPALLSSLEESVGRGHNLLYAAPPRSTRKAWKWFSRDVPALIRRRWAPVGIATLLFFGPALATFVAVAVEPDRVEQLVPAGMLDRARQAESLRAEGIGYGEALIAEGDMPVAAAGILTNNVQVTFLAFVGGMLLGAGTVLILVLNGVMLGGVAAAFFLEGQSLHLWGFVLPHGVLELSAICIAGGAGLWLGSALLLPGRRTRGDALVERGIEAVSMLGGVVVMLVVAGIIEGFISPSPAFSESAKVAFGIFTGLVLFPWILLSGRDPEVREVPDALPLRSEPAPRP